VIIKSGLQQTPNFPDEASLLFAEFSPSGQHKRLDFTVILTANNLEKSILAPPGAPRVVTDPIIDRFSGAVIGAPPETN